VNDTTRQVGGALGVAIIGSVLSSTYGSAISGFFADKPFVPSEAVAAAQGQLGAVPEVAKGIAAAPVPGAQQLADGLTATANQAFVSALHWGVVVAAAATAFGIFVAAMFLPARASRADADEQAEEYAEEHKAEHIPVEPLPVEPLPTPTDDVPIND